MLVKSPSRCLRIPSNACWSTKLLFDTKATMPSRPCKRSVAQRKNFTYGSDSAVLLLALESLAYVSATRLSMTSYFRFLLLSFSFC